MLATGAVRAWRDDKFIGDFVAPTGIKSGRMLPQVSYALEDNTVMYCIHNTHGLPKEALEDELVIEKTRATNFKEKHMKKHSKPDQTGGHVPPLRGVAMPSAPHRAVTAAGAAPKQNTKEITPMTGIRAGTPPTGQEGKAGYASETPRSSAAPKQGESSMWLRPRRHRGAPE